MRFISATKILGACFIALASAAEAHTSTAVEAKDSLRSVSSVLPSAVKSLGPFGMAVVQGNVNVLNDVIYGTGGNVDLKMDIAYPATPSSTTKDSLHRGDSWRWLEWRQ